MKYDSDGTAVDGAKMDAVTDAHRGFGRRQDSIWYDASEGSDLQQHADVACFWLAVKLRSLGSMSG